MQGHFRMGCSFVITRYFHDPWVGRCFWCKCNTEWRGHSWYLLFRRFCGHCGLKVLLGQMHSRLLMTFLIFVIVKSVHGHWGVSFILDHCCSKEICGHCGLKVSLLRWHSRILRAFLLFWEVFMATVVWRCKCLDENRGFCFWSLLL